MEAKKEMNKKMDGYIDSRADERKMASWDGQHVHESRRAMDGRAAESRVMDSTDEVILRLLKENGRETASSISKQIHLSVSAVLDRIHKLEESGIIQHYTVMLDSRKLGYDVLAVMEVRLEHPRFYDQFVAAVSDNDNIIDCYYLTGDFDFNLKICCRSSEELEKLHRFVKEIPGVSATITHYVLKEIKNIYEILP